MPLVSPQILTKLVAFLAVGIPAFLLAIPLNFLLVDKLLWAKPAAYALVLVVQVTINFFACILFVFERDRSRSLGVQFVAFVSGILVARALDWCVYSLLVHTTSIHYLLIQFGNVAMFSVIKFVLARRVIESPNPGTGK